MTWEPALNETRKWKQYVVIKHNQILVVERTFMVPWISWSQLQWIIYVKYIFRTTQKMVVIKSAWLCTITKPHGFRIFFFPPTNTHKKRIPLKSLMSLNQRKHNQGLNWEFLLQPVLIQTSQSGILRSHELSQVWKQVS